ncbi:Inner membrane component of tripartite multidrug resistance system [Desulfurella amilsii]|uniref:Inner membrane component of tripartite multidrug resistance system n=1 Tax=Desulfurella amilsii TaxID=1562698 RepID=A0A1X4XZI0_9BACT|nr:DHA2 family efflux MFS transporter permease subunit [Desulfurella amilsii]OSS42936.1 Inner membrane component of tripartite multidrug resistance system [Desulfurella amilsii]
MQQKVNPYIIALTVMLATFMEVLDTSVANVALPHIAGSLSVTVTDSTWVLTSYLAANAIILPITGWLSQKIGRKRYFIGSIVLFTLSSALCGLSFDFYFLLVARALQGFAGGGLQPVSQAILMESFPEKKRGMAMSIFSIGVIFAPILGPVIGGWLTDQYSWRWVFYINLPVGILATILTMILVEDPPYAKANSKLKIDYLALSFIFIGIASLQIMLDQGQNKDWLNSNLIVVLALSAFFFISMFIIKNAFSNEPIIKFSLFKDLNYSIGVFLMFMTGFVLYSSLALLPILLQTLMGYDALKAGLVIAPGGIASLIIAPIIGKVSNKINVKVLAGLGILLVAYSLDLMSEFNLTASFDVFAWARIVMGFGLPLMFIPINLVAYKFLKKEDMGDASGVINFARNIGGSIGISFAATMLQRREIFQRDALVHNFTQSSIIFQNFLDNTRQYLVTRGFSFSDSYHAAIDIMNNLLSAQSSIIGYQDVFQIIIYFTLPLFILILFIRTKQTKNKRVQS